MKKESCGRSQGWALSSQIFSGKLLATSTGEWSHVVFSEKEQILLHAKLLHCVQLFANPWILACQDSFVCGILQARILDWVAIPFSGDFPNPGIEPASFMSGVAKSRTRLSNFPFTFHCHALEKEMATHSSVLAWRIPGMGEPGGLPSIGSHRVRLK